MKKDGKRKVSAIKNNFYFLKLVWQISPSAVILNFFYDRVGLCFMGVLFGIFLAVSFRRGRRA